MADENAEVVRRFFEGIINEGRLELADEVLAPDYRDHAPLTAEVPGPEGFKRRMQLLASSFEMRIAIEDMTVEDDRVAFRWTMTGRHVGEFGGAGADRQSGHPHRAESRAAARRAHRRSLERVRPHGPDAPGRRGRLGRMSGAAGPRRPSAQ